MANRSVLDPQLLELVERFEQDPAAEAAAGPVEVLIGVQADNLDEIVANMRGLGLEIGTVAGDVISGRVPAGGLVAISDLPGVLKVELGSPQMPEDFEPIDYTE